MLLEYGSRMLLKKIDALCGRTRRLEKHISLVLLALNSNLCMAMYGSDRYANVWQ